MAALHVFTPTGRPQRRRGSCACISRPGASKRRSGVHFRLARGLPRGTVGFIRTFPGWSSGPPNPAPSRVKPRRDDCEDQTEKWRREGRSRAGADVTGVCWRGAERAGGRRDSPCTHAHTLTSVNHVSRRPVCVCVSLNISIYCINHGVTWQWLAVFAHSKKFLLGSLCGVVMFSPCLRVVAYSKLSSDVNDSVRHVVLMSWPSDPCRSAPTLHQSTAGSSTTMTDS